MTCRIQYSSTGSNFKGQKNFKNYITLPDFLKLQESSTLCWNIYSSWAHCGSIHDEKCRIHVNSQVCRNILHTFEKNPVLQKINKLKFSPRYFIIVANILSYVVVEDRSFDYIFMIRILVLT